VWGMLILVKGRTIDRREGLGRDRCLMGRERDLGKWKLVWAEECGFKEGGIQRDAESRERRRYKNSGIMGLKASKRGIVECTGELRTRRGNCGHGAHLRKC